MRKLKQNRLSIATIAFVGLLIAFSSLIAVPAHRLEKMPFLQTFVSQEPDTTAKPLYPVPADKGEPAQQLESHSPLHLSDPPNIKREVV